MSNEDAKFFAGEMEDFLDIPAMLCEAIEKRLAQGKYKEGKDDWIAINKEEFELRLQSYKDSLNNK